MHPLSSDRLMIRPWNLEQDGEAAFAIYGDPEVKRFLRTPAAMTIEAAREQVASMVIRIWP